VTNKVEDITFRTSTKSSHLTKGKHWAYYRSIKDVQNEPALLGYAHHIIRAFDKEVLGISGVLCIDGKPTVYFRRDEQQISWTEANHLQRVFWNQGIATILILADPEHLRIYSGQAHPVKEGDSSESPASLVPLKLDTVANLLELESLLHKIASGEFYTTYAEKFNEKQAIDETLLHNLSDTRDLLLKHSTSQKINKESVHTLLGQLIFLCYLTDRKILNWDDYKKEVGEGVTNIQQLLEKYNHKEGLKRLDLLFTRLHDIFNGSLFDDSDDVKWGHLNSGQYMVLKNFFSFSEVATQQLTFGFWAYDFSVIPVETISAIYEDFLTAENTEAKRKEGVYYTPRHLAEMVVDTAIQGNANWAKCRYLDPACGSGIFLVTIFNRIASKWIFDNLADNYNNPTKSNYKKQAKALEGILHTQLQGIDKKLTACRITCFSLYLAFLDQFKPRELREFAKLAERDNRKVLPKLLYYPNRRWTEKYVPTVINTDSLQPSNDIGKFDYIIGNPPWAGRGTQQIAWKFMKKAPDYLRNNGYGCLLLPTKVFFNKTEMLQLNWFQEVAVERIINLSDFSFILFEYAKCPAMIVRFLKAKPILTHLIEYETPKVSNIDNRGGIITIFPHDRKKIKLSDILTASKNRTIPSFWKFKFSGTPRDWRLLEFLDDIPKLGRLTCSPYSQPKNWTRWFKGQGIMPDHKLKSPKPEYPWWKPDRLFLDANSENIQMFVFPSDCEPVGNRFPQLYRRRHPDIFEPPLVLISQGYGKVAFCDFPLLFQSSLQAITSASSDPERRANDEELLLFLTVYLRSRLANYYLFHTSANWGIERDKVLLSELLSLPFPLPGDPHAHHNAKAIVKKVVVATKKLLNELAGNITIQQNPDKLFHLGNDFNNLPGNRKKKIDGLQNLLEHDIYQYFDLNEEEIALVEDTIKIVEPSSTPSTRECLSLANLLSLAPINEKILQDYAVRLTSTLNEWAKDGPSRVEASASIFNDNTFVLFTLTQVKKPKDFHLFDFDKSTEALFQRIYASAIQEQGYINHPRVITFFEGKNIYLLKPARHIHWTQTEALNDADEIFAKIIRERRGTF